MPAQDTSQIKEKIISSLRRKGPSLPVHIAKEVGSNMLFTSAFLSELISEKKIKISNMKVGSSPLYLLQGQEPLIEKFSQYLKSKEKEAFLLLKERKFLKDSEQEPAIRVALREIKDFAIPFKHSEEIMWRFFTENEDNFTEEPIIQEIREIPKEVDKDISKDSLKIFKKQKIAGKPAKGKTKKPKKENKFFENVKNFLSENQIELVDILNFSKNEIVLKVKKNGQEEIIFAYCKKKIDEKDIIKAAKKSLEYRLDYQILSLGEPLKKLSDLIESVKTLKSIKKLK